MTSTTKTHRTIQALREIHGLMPVAWEDLAAKTIEVVIVGTSNGWDIVSQVDACDAGAEARAIALVELVHEVLGAAEDGWSRLMLPTSDGGAS
jgi:hypothetical protein